jgi:hypothetical protein
MACDDEVAKWYGLTAVTPEQSLFLKALCGFHGNSTLFSFGVFSAHMAFQDLLRELRGDLIPSQLAQRRRIWELFKKGQRRFEVKAAFGRAVTKHDTSQARRTPKQAAMLEAITAFEKHQAAEFEWRDPAEIELCSEAWLDWEPAFIAELKSVAQEAKASDPLELREIARELAKMVAREGVLTRVKEMREQGGSAPPTSSIP